MSSPQTVSADQDLSPVRPDIDLIDNLEGNKRILEDDRAAARKYLAELDQKERERGQR